MKARKSWECVCKSKPSWTVEVVNGNWYILCEEKNQRLQIFHDDERLAGNYDLRKAYCMDVTERLWRLGFGLEMLNARINKMTKACEVVRDFLKKRSHPRFPDGLMLMGNVGCGKTWAAIAYFKARYYYLPGFLYRMPHLYLAGWDTWKEIITGIRSHPHALVVMDDFGAERSADDRWYNFLDNLINTLYEAQPELIITTNLKEDELVRKYGVRIMDRIKGMVRLVELKEPSYRRLK